MTELGRIKTDSFVGARKSFLERPVSTSVVGLERSPFELQSYHLDSLPAGRYYLYRIGSFESL